MPTSGFVSRVELDNFKSWKGKQFIGPFRSGFNAIIGSNGAGKSNLMDSISFVTGLKAKKLRGDQLKDLIYDADKKAEEENRKMKVSLTYSVGQGELERMRQGEEIVFSRSVIYSTSGSIFEIDGKQVTYQEYEKVFSKLNILVSARNFLIFQGDVEQTASKSPLELTTFFEQVSGSDSYKEEYERLKTEKDRLEAETLDKVQQAKLAKAEKKEAKDQKAETDRFNELQQERDDLKVEFVLFQLDQAEKNIEETRNNLEEAKNKVAEAKNVEAGMEEELKKSNSELAQKKRDVSKTEKATEKASKEAKNLKLAYENQITVTNRDQSKRKEAEHALRSAKETLEKHSKETNELMELIENLKEKEQAMISEKHQGEEEEEDEEEEEELSSEKREELERLRMEADRLTAELKVEETRLARELETMKESVALAKVYEDQQQNQVKQGQAQKATHIATKTKREQSVSSNQVQAAETEKQLKEKQISMKKLEKEIELKKVELEKIKQVINESKARTIESKRTKKNMETVQALSRRFEGVRGRLVDLVRPTQKKYALAVETALGKHMDSIVIDRESTGFECLKLLREQRLGTATFLPLDAIKTKTISEEKRKLAGSGGPYRLCIDLIEYDDPSLERAVRFAAGDSMICDSLSDARKLCFQNNVRVKAVTLDGHFISQRGEMTGGAVGDGRTDRFAESELQNAKDGKDRLEKELGEMESSYDVLKKDFQQLSTLLTSQQNQLKFAKTDLEEANLKLESCENQLKLQGASLKKAEKERQARENELQSLQTALEKLQSQIAEKENSVFQNVEGIKGNAKEVERREAAAKSKLRQDMKEIREQIGKLESQLRYIQSTDRELAVKNCEKQLSHMVEQAQHSEEETKKKKLEAEEAEQAAKQIETQLSRVLEELNVAISKHQECQKRLTEASKEKGRCSKHVTQMESDYQKVISKKEEIVKQAVLEAIELPKTEDDKFDFSVLDRPHFSDDNGYVEKLKLLMEEIESLAPKANAETRFQEAAEKLKGTDADVSEAMEIAKEAKNAFEKVRKARLEAFKSMFTNVSEKIDGVYKELTKRPNAPLGGSAFLALEDDENPFLGGVKFECMPPNKRYRAMEQLSGGEKTIAALALLFAIHSFRPSPFFVLDEVDAALDNHNVERVSSYIQKRTSENAFQCLVISLKDTFFCKAEALIGVYRDAEEDSSRCMTLDLSNYAF